ncbi:TetR/AcrR family transcriptional regulator [Amycolatopsis sp. NPDC059021]|uniref:TetR/AcrR family transcriptional regulator n=1 Tax=Amycolatopsis sp. NPDC059021 TaxID=3346704 RepID=UPI00367274FC
MKQDTPPPGTGLARRRRRLSDEETGQRMLQAATAMVTETGLTVSLDHISLEDVIRDAGVSRSAAYRRWPYKDLFFSDLLKELAKGTSPEIGANPDALAAIGRVVLDRLDWIETPERRLAVAAEALRHGALDEFELFHRSAQWRTYFALHATFLSLPDGELRDEVQSALATSEQALIAGIATAYRQVTTLLGLRLRPELDASYETVATLATATMRGLILMAPANPAIATTRFQANPFGAPEAAEWSQPALGMAGVTLTFFEPDPGVVWDEQRAVAARELLTSGDWTRT